MSTPLPLRLSAKAMRTADSPINALISAKLANPDLINFAAGLVDEGTLPVDEVAAIARQLFSEARRGQRVLQYGTAIGLRELRKELVAHLERLDGKAPGELGLSAEDVLLSTGSQQALYLIADVLLDPGDIVITANPSYFVFTGALQSTGARVLAAPMDDDGMDVDAVERILTDLERRGDLARVKFIYCTSFFDNPTGLSLSTPRRKRLLEIVKRFSSSHRILILEDAAYRELRYDGEVLPSVKSLDPQNQFTIITQTFSKPFAPGIKLGYTAVPPDLMEQVLRQKGNHDFGSSNLCQEIALEAMTNGSYVKHLDVLKKEYRRKRDATLAALRANLTETPELHWTHPKGGIYVWLTLPKHVNTARDGSLFERCVKHGVLFVPGAYSFHPDEQGKTPNHHMRLCFGQVTLDEIGPGIERLAGAINEEIGAVPVSAV
jgi:2-aminoadipate transaminase